ncbi:MAG: SpoIIE family protein phosphatase [bacterium]|nr:SpoIIE family protein phosphatase [bacterium]
MKMSNNQKYDKAKILIVDDRPENLFALEEILKDLDCKIVKAYSGNQALQKILKYQFALIMLDVQMPNMDGFETAQLIRGSGESREIPIIFVTAINKEQKYIFKGYESGAVDYLPKPIEPKILRNKVKVFLKLFYQKQELEEKVLELNRLREVEAKQSRRIRSEISKVRQIQASFAPRFDGLKDYFDISTLYLPVDDLSGDFYDGFFLNDELYQLILCDVSGHGIASSYVGNQIRSIFRTTSLEETVPSKLIFDVNNILVEDLWKTSYFGTVIVCQLEVSTGKLIFSSGGHPTAIYYHAAKDECSFLNTTGALIGVAEERDYKDITLQMEKGDILLLYTDGITEALADDGKTMYDIERLTECFLKNIHKGSMEIIHSIVDSLYEFIDYAMLDDDITLICVKKK